MEKTEIETKDPLADYRPFLDELNRDLEKWGEAATMQRFGRDTTFVRILQSAHRLAFQHVRDISKLSPEELVGFTSLAFKVSYGIRRFFPAPDRWNIDYVDFGKDIPSAYIDWLLSTPHPFDRFLSNLFIIELGKLCSAEMERRSKEHPELIEIENYKEATPVREAEKYLQKRTLSERIQLARKYGLEVLSDLETAINKGLNLFAKLAEEKYGIQKGYSEFSKALYRAGSEFPRYEKELCAKFVAKSIFPPELEKYIGVQCEDLIRCVAIDRFGLSIKGGYSAQEYKASQAITEMGEILKTKGIAWKRKDSLPGIGFSRENKRQEAESIAQLGLLKGMNIWADKDMDKVIIAGLTGHLKYSLKKAVVNKLLDEIDKVHKVTIQDEYGEYKVQREIPVGTLVSENTEYTSDDLLELLAARQGLVETSFEDELDNRDLLDRILQEAMLPKRQRLVIDLTRDGRGDIDIALALEKAFNKRVTEGNVRKLRHKAIQKLRLYAAQE